MTLNKLQAFIYLLIRDELPSGTVLKIIMDINNEGEFESDGPLARMATEYADILVNFEEPKYIFGNDPGWTDYDGDGIKCQEHSGE